MPLPSKRRRPLSQSELLMFSVEAVMPATSITEPAPKVMPEGLIRNTRPFDRS